MNENKYLKWLSENTDTVWWHDSADPDEIAIGIANGAVGITTNPLLIKHALYNKKRPWASMLSAVPKDIAGDEKAEEIIKRISIRIAGMFEPIYRRTDGKTGICLCAG